MAWCDGYHHLRAQLRTYQRRHLNDSIGVSMSTLGHGAEAADRDRLAGAIIAQVTRHLTLQLVQVVEKDRLRSIAKDLLMLVGSRRAQERAAGRDFERPHGVPI